MKKKGFTLIELLAVIVILLVITLITVPMITSVIEESKKKALLSSVQGLIESANLYAIENEGVYEFLFDAEHQGITVKGESLDYRGKIEGEGKLYIDKEGNTSICISNDKYYAYKNYNSEIMIGERSTDNCNIEYDALTNKYIAFLESKGSGSNVYSKDEVDNLVDSLQNQISSLNTNVDVLSSTLSKVSDDVVSIKSSLDSLSLVELYGQAFEKAELLYSIRTKGITSISIDKDEYPYLLVGVFHAFSDGWWSNSPYQLVKTSMMGYENEFTLRGTYASIRRDVTTDSWQKLTSVYIPYDNYIITIYGIKG